MPRFRVHVPVRRLRLHGMEIAYRQVTGPAGAPRIVLVHGMAGSSKTWLPLLRLLDGHADVVAVDLLGHGDSPKGRSLDHSLGNQAALVRDVMVALGIESATVVGQSLGGGVVLQFAYQFPEMVERIALVDAGGLGKEVSLLLRALSLPGSGFVLSLATAKPLLAWLGLWSRVGHDLGLRLAPEQREIAAAYVSLADPATRRSFLSTLRSVVDVHGQAVAARNRLHLTEHVPVLVAWGDRDGIIPAVHADRITEVVPHARVELFEGAGHFPHDSQPERFAEVLLDFVTTTTAGSLDPAALAAAS